MKKEDGDGDSGEGGKERERKMSSGKKGEMETATKMLNAYRLSRFTSCCSPTTHETLPWLVIAIHVLVCVSRWC